MNRRSQNDISIVILSYKNFAETTQRCLASLVCDASFENWEVLIVDNDSGPETRRSLSELPERHSNVRLVLNDVNLGFAGGMNVGLREATGRVVFLLNSDTEIADGAIGRMADLLRNEKDLGMVAPVTNSAGNEQRIFVSDDSSAEAILSEGKRFADCGESHGITAYRLDFCVVGIDRSVFEKIGGLDEAFGRGYYEDFDYSLCALKAGFRIAVAENAFVYHHGSASFGSIDPETKRLIAANKRRLTDKHGPGIVFPHAREANLFVLQQYVNRLAQGLPVSKYRVLNRVELAMHDRPRSPLKRWRYLRKLNAVVKRLHGFGISS